MLDEHLRRCDGVVTLAQARLAGISRHAVERRVLAGRWRRCSPGVYFVDDRPFTDAARIRAAVWAYGDRAVGSGLTAAWWHGLTQFAPSCVEVTVPRDSNGRRYPGSRVRRRDLDAADIVERERLRVTAKPLTVLEAAIQRHGGPQLMDRALQHDLELRELWRAQMRNKGRYGSPAARRLLQAASDGTRSQAERRLVDLLRRARIVGWVTDHPVGRYRVDLAFPGPRVAVEVDGWAFHSDQVDFQRDRVRQNELALLGWQVLRFTWLDLTEYPERVLAVVRSALSA